MTFGAGRIFSAFLIMIIVLVSIIPAAGAEQKPGNQGTINNPEIVPVNQTGLNETALEQFRKHPEPVTVFHAEVSEKSLPGPRYMAFGPGVIDISMIPELFGACVVLVSVILAIGIIRSIGAWGREPKD